MSKILQPVYGLSKTTFSLIGSSSADQHIPLIRIYAGISRADFCTGTFANLVIFFLLRVGDEHKDHTRYRNYPPLIRRLYTILESRIITALLFIPAAIFNIIHYSSLPASCHAIFLLYPAPVAINPEAQWRSLQLPDKTVREIGLSGTHFVAAYLPNDDAFRNNKLWPHEGSGSEQEMPASGQSSAKCFSTVAEHSLFMQKSGFLSYAFSILPAGKSRYRISCNTSRRQ